MKTKRTKGVYLVIGMCVVLALGLSLFGCAPAVKEVAPPIKLGISQDITGVMAPQGRAHADGAILCVEDWNAKGGVNGRHIEYIFRNNGADPVRASASCKLFVEMGVVAVHGGSYSTNGIAESKILNPAQIPLTLGSAALAHFEEVGPDGKNYAFTFVGSDPYLSRPGLEVAVMEGYKKIAILYLNVAWPKDLKELQLEWIEKHYGPKYGIEVVGMLEADVKSADFSIEAVKIKAMNPDMVLTEIYTGNEIAWVRALTDLNWPIPWHDGAACAESAWMIAEDQSVWYNCFGNSYVSGLRAETQALKARLEERIGYDVTASHWVCGYDAFDLVLRAIEEVGDDPVAIRDWLATEAYGQKVFSGHEGFTVKFSDEAESRIGRTGYYGHSLYDGTDYPEFFINKDGSMDWQKYYRKPS